MSDLAELAPIVLALGLLGAFTLALIARSAARRDAALPPPERVIDFTGDRP